MIDVEKEQWGSFLVWQQWHKWVSLFGGYIILPLCLKHQLFSHICVVCCAADM